MKCHFTRAAAKYSQPSTLEWQIKEKIKTITNGHSRWAELGILVKKSDQGPKCVGVFF